MPAASKAAATEIRDRKRSGAGIQTLYWRCVEQSMELPPAEIVFIDEGHHSAREPIMTSSSNIPTVSHRLDRDAGPRRRQGLGNVFETIVECPQISELIN